MGIVALVVELDRFEDGLGVAIVCGLPGDCWVEDGADSCSSLFVAGEALLVEEFGLSSCSHLCQHKALDLESFQ